LITGSNEIRIKEGMGGFIVSIPRIDLAITFINHEQMMGEMGQGSDFMLGGTSACGRV
jgi:hypothetical protein